MFNYSLRVNSLWCFYIECSYFLLYHVLWYLILLSSLRSWGK